MRLIRWSVLAVVGLVGCGHGISRVGEPVPVTGKVVLANGKPVKDLLLVLNPIEKGRPDSVRLNSDGSFSGNLVPGKYAFYFATPEVRGANPAALRAVPEKFRSHQVEQFVQVNGGDVTIAVQ